MAYKFDKEVEGLLTQIIVFIAKTTKNIFTSIYYGLKKLKSKKVLIVFLLTLLASTAAYFLNVRILEIKIVPLYLRNIIYYFLLILPLIYLIAIGSSQDTNQNKFYKIFQDIAFKGRDNKYPYFCAMHKEGKKKVYVFKSNIPLSEWKSSKARLEVGFDCNILRIEEGQNKKIVKMSTVPSDCKIPVMIKWNDNLLHKESGIITVGQGALDQITFNLNRTPHALFAGETGSGKSVLLRTCLWQMINQSSKIYMIDFKGGVEFGKQYEKYGEVITERDRALKVFTDLVYENQYRLTLFRDLEVKNLDEYNKKTRQNLCRIGVFCDEIGEMLDKKGVSKDDKVIFEQIEGKLSTLARLSRATGINLFLGVQRPDANILPGQIKNNIPVRISGRFADKSVSEIVLGNTDATELPDIKGRFLYKVGNETIEFQSYYFDDDTMLKDLNIEVGDMLTEAPTYNPASTPTTSTSEKIDKVSVAEPKKSGKGILKGKKKGEADFVYVSKEQAKQQKEMEKMDEYDLNLDFSNFDEEREESL